MHWSIPTTMPGATCLEVTVLEGEAAALRHFAEHVIAERGVHHGMSLPNAAGATASS